MLIPIFWFAVGLVLLIKGGDWFVEGATRLARRFHIPELIVGATVVSIGTTLPEVMVSATSAVSGHGEIAYGNAIGSIICNTALIAALSATIRPSAVDRKALRAPVLFFFVAAAGYAAVAYLLGTFTRWVGVVLLALFVAYMLYTVWQVRKNPTALNEESIPAEVPQEETAASKKRVPALLVELVLLAVGAAAIAVGADLLVDNGTLIAEALGVPESVIALTFVALGTSLPELVTAVTSLIKGHGALSLGNIIGANLFNLVLVSGVSVALSPFDVPVSQTVAGHNASLVLDIPLMLGVMAILTLPALFRGKLSRVQGVVLLALYAAFCTVQFLL